MLSILVVLPSERGDHEWFSDFLKEGAEFEQMTEKAVCKKILRAYRQKLDVDADEMDLPYSQVEIPGFTPKEVNSLDGMLMSYNEKHDWNYTYKIVRIGKFNRNRLIVVLLSVGTAIIEPILGEAFV